MRFSPVLLASITVSAGLGFASSAEASSVEALGQPGRVERSTHPRAAATKPSMDVQKPYGQALAPVHSLPNIAVPMASAPETSLGTGARNSVPESGGVGRTLNVASTPVEFSLDTPERLLSSPDILSTTGQTDSNEASSRSDEATLATSDGTTLATLLPALERNADFVESGYRFDVDTPTDVDAGLNIDAGLDIDAAVEALRQAQVPDEPDTPAAETEDADPTDADPSPEPETPSLPDAEAVPDVEDAPASPDVAEEEDDRDPRVLIAEVNVVGVDDQPELLDEVYRAIQTRPGRTTTRSQLQDDINAIFATGFFRNVQAEPEDTPLGVRVTFLVRPNPVLQEVAIADSALSESETTLEFGGEQFTVDELTDTIFSPQYGQTLNLRDFQAGIEQLNTVYSENGYVLAQVVDAPDISEDGVVTLVVAEGVIEDIQVQFLDEDGFAEDEDGNPIDGRTRDFIITREFESQPGDVFNQRQIQRDLQEVFALGIFEDVRVSLNPGEDPRQVDVIVNVIEGNTGSVAAGAGFSSASGLFGSASYRQQNLGGNNQQLGTEVQFGERELGFDIRFTDPWIATDPYRTSYTVNTFLRRSISLIFDGGDTEVDLCEERNDFNCDQDDLEDGDRPRVQRLGGGVSFSRPLDEWLGWENWRGSAGFQYQRVSIRDSDGDLSFIDALGNRLSFSDNGKDDLYTLQLAAVRDLRNNPQQPTSGSLLRLGTEQSIPIGSGSILLNRVRASYSHYIPADITSFNDGPEAFAFNVQAGTVIGDLPPYEAFSLGGTDSVRGYDAGDLGSGRSFVQATAEYRFPLFSIVGGALFLDFGSDLGTSDNVPGSPADARDKPGTGFGYGLGVRVQSPLGQIRVDYGINDDGDGRIHFGIGERF